MAHPHPPTYSQTTTCNNNVGRNESNNGPLQEKKLFREGKTKPSQTCSRCAKPPGESFAHLHQTPRKSYDGATACALNAAKTTKTRTHKAMPNATRSAILLRVFVTWWLNNPDAKDETSFS